MPSFLQNLKQFLGRLTAGQQVALGFVLVGGLAFMTGIAYWANQPNYALLFGRLASTDASKVVEALQTQGVRYELRENGTAIFVPHDQVYELRLHFAGEGLISEGPTGYELFDRGTLGMTDFMQKLNLRRALEGELARTVTNIRQVEMARVHLVIPERSAFRATQMQPTASVVLQLGGGSRLGHEQIDGITALVAGAVEGLDPADVTVLDTRGNMLSDPNASDPEALAGSYQLQMQRAVETHLTENGQTMLDRVLGPGNAIVRVAAALDFSRAVSERDVIDPESATIISEERLEEAGGPEASANSSVRNYELSRTRERSEKSVGDVDYLTVSVILNYKRPDDAAGEAAAGEAAAPYAEGDLVEIESLVKNAVGFNPERGDRFAIHQTRFDTSVDDRIAGELRDERQQEQLQLYLRYALMVMALVLAAWLIRSAARRVSTVAQGDAQRLAAGRPASLGEGAAGAGSLTAAERALLSEDVYTRKLSPAARRRLQARHLMFDDVKQQVAERPEEAAHLVRAWMAEDAEE